MATCSSRRPSSAGESARRIVSTSGSSGTRQSVASVWPRIDQADSTRRPEPASDRRAHAARRIRPGACRDGSGHFRHVSIASGWPGPCRPPHRARRPSYRPRRRPDRARRARCMVPGRAQHGRGRARDGLEHTRDGLWPTRDGLWPTRDGLWPTRDGRGRRANPTRSALLTARTRTSGHVAAAPATRRSRARAPAAAAAAQRARSRPRPLRQRVRQRGGRGHGYRRAAPRPPRGRHI
jgi:hypothetical protein